MPDYADNYTARYVLQYTAGGMGHKQMWRYGAALDFGAIEAAVDSITDVWGAVATYFPDDLVFTGAVFYPKDGDVGIPAGLPAGINDVVTGGFLAPEAGPKYLSLPWQTIAGGRQTLFFYGTALEPSGIVGKNYRAEAAENAGLDLARTRFNAMASSITGNDGQPGRLCKAYFNYGVNPALVRRKRRG